MIFKVLIGFSSVFVNTILLYYSSLSVFTRPQLDKETIILTSGHLLFHRQYNINRV